MEEKKTSVALTAEELAAFEEFKAEKAKKAALARVAALRDNYSELSEAFIKRTIKKLTPLSQKISEKKAEVLDEFSALQKVKAELLGLNDRDMPKSHTFTNKAGTMRVTVGTYETDGYDDSVEEGITIVKEYIESLAKDKNSAQLVKMVMGLLARSASGPVMAPGIIGASSRIA